MISTDLVARDLTSENAELREELRQAHAELREMEQTNHRFVVLASNELRTPLAILFGYAKLMEHGNDTGDVHAYAGIISDQARQLKITVDLMLLMDQIDTGELRLRPDRLLLSQVVERAVDSRQRDIAAKGLSVEIQIEDAPLVMEADGEKLPFVIGQLLANAINRSPHGESIAIQAHVTDVGVVVSFRDNGDAIAPSERMRAFNWAYGDIQLTDQRSGSELGLAVARALVELQGGRIWIEGGEDRGITLSFSIPAFSNRPGASKPA